MQYDATKQPGRWPYVGTYQSRCRVQYHVTELFHQRLRCVCAVWLVKEQVCIAAMDGPHPKLALQMVEQIRHQFPNSKRADRVTVAPHPCCPSNLLPALKPPSCTAQEHSGSYYITTHVDAICPHNHIRTTNHSQAQTFSYEQYGELIPSLGAVCLSSVMRVQLYDRRPTLSDECRMPR